MGVYPYITATIIMQLLIPVIPSLEALSKEPQVQVCYAKNWLQFAYGRREEQADLRALGLAAVEIGGFLLQHLLKNGDCVIQIFTLKRSAAFLVQLAQIGTHRVDAFLRHEFSLPILALKIHFRNCS